MPKSTSFAEICPLKQVENDILFSHKGDISVIYKLTLPDVMTLTDDDYQSVQAAFAASINTLPAGFMIQRLDFVHTKSSSLQQQSVGSILEQKNLIYLNAKPALYTDSYLIITFSSNAKPTYANSWFSVFSKSTEIKTISKQYIKQLIQKAEAIIKQITEPLKTKGLSAIQLSSQEINKLVLSKYFAFGFLKEPEPVNLHVDYADLKDAATVGGNIIKVFSLLKSGLPENIYNVKAEGNYYKKGISEIPVSFLHDLSFNLSFPHIINQVIYSIDNSEVYSQLKRKRNLLRGLSWANAINGRNSDSIDTLINLKEGGAHKLVEYHLSVTAIAPNQDRELLQHYSNELTSYFENSGFQYCENAFNTLRYFFSAAPGSASDIPSEHRALLLSDQAACFHVWEQAVKSAPTGVLFVDRKTDQPIRVDLWNHPLITNRNKIIIGASGTGKSFLTNKLISDFIDMGDDVFVTDIGSSYETLIQLYKGDLIEFTPSQPLRLNPFLLSGKNADIFLEPDADTLDFITMLLFTAWQSANKTKITSEVNAVLKLLIVSFYKHVNKTGLFPDFDNFYDHAISELETNDELSNLTIDTFNKESFKLVMRGFLTGKKAGNQTAYGDLFNCSENTNLVDSRFVVFELKHIKGDPVRFPLAFFIVIYIVSQKLNQATQRRRNKKVHFFMDEVWSVLKGEYGDAKGFIEFAFRAFRKEGGCISIISQSLSDIFSNSEVGDSIKANCDIKIFKYIDQSESNIIDKHLDLSEFNKQVLFSLKDKYKDICVFFKDQACVYKLDVAPYTEGAYTTAPDERRWRSEELAKTGNIQTVLQNFSDKKDHKI